ncbi:hypothetical protein BC643_1309 [Mangrovibacterium diazotrophicum]|uniref:Uncharacterized protein n=1 Tax=Mangrovibacterium diazotrophicum TaxID=1261403 RepID=A0A419W6F2_9BACT|nr:hypothetical protein BC643_1309 [Mangrovibacterium diazotrophicum]
MYIRSEFSLIFARYYFRYINNNYYTTTMKNLFKSGVPCIRNYRPVLPDIGKHSLLSECFGNNSVSRITSIEISNPELKV